MDGAHHGRIVPHIAQAGQGGEPAEAPELPEWGTAVRQPGGVPTAAHQQAHAPAIPEQRGIEIPCCASASARSSDTGTTGR